MTGHAKRGKLRRDREREVTTTRNVDGVAPAGRFSGVRELGMKPPTWALPGGDQRTTEPPLTVVQLQDAVVALDVRKPVAHLDAVGVGRDVVAHVLLHLVLAARRVRVVAPRVVGVDHAGVVGVVFPGEGVLVEALLRHHAVGVVEVVHVAQEELEVALRWVGGKMEGGGRGTG